HFAVGVDKGAPGWLTRGSEIDPVENVARLQRLDRAGSRQKNELFAHREGGGLMYTPTTEQVQAAARAIYISDREDTPPDGFSGVARSTWDRDLAAERDRYLRHARVALEAAGFTVPEED